MAADSALHHPHIHALYSDHHGWLQGWLRKKLGNAFDAADLAQDTFVRILAAPDHTPEKQGDWQLSEPRAYLTVVAKRLLANLYRRRSLEQAYLDALGAMPEPLAPSPEQQALILETLQEIDAMLDGLAPPVRQAFLMAQLEGLGYAEIALKLSVSERTVKRYMAEAMARCILLVE
ncbi:sigma-70 family RNA polymerase sigma factor [Variovorax sp. J22G73]|jgi:RNA polymerase sigma-70 factor (ECF subfamily)|uniref:sigma-70 family RNA polymerase sigma factor n=1 Tax=unclassified Variovorax TaxID=663243 RepID=UPI000D5F81CA|nr:MULTISPECIES: sigma-70 family RNA polymerase sigma factor [unclassified Variovorax]MDM0007262.1 sigma-70 family RNA polymerase sigma factor [Variovorax sp. J22R203]MDM0098986.1 sigma-70 family RNA polymerase sigma factor [Variovorax sp. J22G73]